MLHRHASAGERFDSPDLDLARPLDRVGRADARKLPELLASHEIAHIVSSPLRRCVESVQPLALARGLALELRDELAPDAAVRATRSLLDELPDDTLVCTHREVIERLFQGRIACQKGGTWILGRMRSRLVPLEYIAPPTTIERERRLGAFARSR